MTVSLLSKNLAGAFFAHEAIPQEHSNLVYWGFTPPPMAAIKLPDLRLTIPECG